VPFLPQSRRHEIGDAAIVFYDEQTHGPSSAVS